MSVGWIITLVILAILGIGGLIGWQYISKEHNEARNLPLNSIDFDKLKDGTYIGEYEGGMYKWRVNSVEVVVEEGKVKNIKMLTNMDPKEDNEELHKLYNRVIEKQSLQVDLISMATLSSKGYLRAIELALEKAQ